MVKISTVKSNVVSEQNIRRSERYLEHLKSPEWKALRALVLERANHQCERCGATGTLQVHHRTYARLGYELLDDLQAVCVICHERADEERASAARAAVYHKRVDAWARKRYGSDWDVYRDAVHVEEEFDNWLQDREDRGIY